MAAPASTLRLSASNRIEDLAVQIDAVAAFVTAWAVAPDDRAQVLIILDEIASNIVKNAWPAGGDHRFLIDLHISEAAQGLDLVMRTTDDGAMFDPTTAAAPDLDLSLEDREPGGLGLFMAREMSDAMHYSRPDGLNCLTILKHLRRDTALPV
jgi:anti-sigma regulatory factor (Ser/Thr protein kinase)